MTKAEVADQRKWQAEDDARALAAAEQIKADAARMGRARAAARRLLREEEKRLSGLRKITKPKSARKGTNSGGKK